MNKIPTVEIRLAGLDDRNYLETLEAILKTRQEPNYVDLLFQAVEQGQRHLVLAFTDGNPAGYAVVNWAPIYSLFARLGIPELQDLNVLPDCRRNGIGEELVKACEELVRSRGHSELGLGVGLDRRYGQAQRLYARMGYQPDGYGITYDREPVTAGEVRAVDDNLCLMLVKAL